jgi:hypothetical protein
LECYYQLTPHDLYDHDLQLAPILTTVNGRLVVVAAGRGGIVTRWMRTGKLLRKRPVGAHSGHDNDGLKTINGPAGMPNPRSARAAPCPRPRSQRAKFVSPKPARSKPNQTVEAGHPDDGVLTVVGSVGYA